MLTLETMNAMWPHGNTRPPGLVEGIVSAAPDVFAKYGLNSDLVIAHAMAQFSHECGAGTELEENINYTPERACQVWPLRFSSTADCLEKVGSFAGDPDFRTKLIDNVYGGRNGNRPGTNDGSVFIGRGLSQVTGRGIDLSMAVEVANQNLQHQSNCHLVQGEVPSNSRKSSTMVGNFTADFDLRLSFPMSLNSEADNFVTRHSARKQYSAAPQSLRVFRHRLLICTE